MRPPPTPPRLALAFLRWFCAPQWRDEIEGDLTEQFARRCQRRPRWQARLLYWKDLLLFVRPYVLRRGLLTPSPVGPMMWQNYLKTALRTLKRHQGYASINIGGLAVGLACCLLMLLYVQDALRYDRFHENADRLYRVVTDLQTPDGNVRKGPQVVWPVGRILRAEYPEIERVVYMRFFEGRTRLDGRYHNETIRFAENTFFDAFTFPLVAGDPATALAAPYSLVLTETMAEKYFPNQQAVGQALVIEDTLTFTVTGIVADPPRHSSLTFDMLASFATFTQWRPEFYESAHWLDVDMMTFVTLREDADPEAVQAKIEHLLMERQGDQYRELGYIPTLHLEPYTAVYLRSERRNPFGPKGEQAYVYLLGAVGLFVLLIAAFNFVNLSTARAAGRAREVGVRKAIGSTRGRLIQQFLGESMLTTLLALTLGLGLAAAALPAFNTLAQKSLVLGDLLTGPFLLGLLALGLAVGLLAGLYPAFVLSSFRPALVLKGTAHLTGGGARLRQGLVVLQFALSILLMLGTLTAYQQVRHMQRQHVGFDREQVLVIDARGAAEAVRQGSVETVKQALRHHPAVQQVSATNTVPGRDGWRSKIVFPEGLPRAENLIVEYIAIDADYRETVGLEIVAGRDFDPAFSSDLQNLDTRAPGGLLINEAAVEAMRWETPENALGKFIDSPSGVPKGTVVGVVRDYHHHGLQEQIQPIVFGRMPDTHFALYHYFAVRLDTDAALPDALAHLEATWGQFFDGHPFDAFFLDEDFDRQYQDEERIARIFFTFAGLALLVSCLGLFGLAAFTATQRRKEIGVRKVLGATVPGLVTLLAREFLLLIGAAFVLAAPIAYVLLDGWLEAFAYRIDLGLGLFALVGGLALLIALLTVSYQALRAALADPVQALRYE